MNHSNFQTSTNETPASDAATSWHLKLFEKSVLKQAKFSRLTNALEGVKGQRFLDLGSDNGVISHLLRERGGEWHSGDLSAETVESIRSVVAENVFLYDQKRFPFEDGFFDAVVVVDMLEHVEDDRHFASELTRVLTPGGVLIINAPNRKPYSPLRFFRHLIGQTDEAHGHLRPGYTVAELKELLGKDYEHVFSRTYSRFFTEFIDTLIVFAYSLLKGHKSSSENEEPSKGLVFTEADMKKLQKTFKLYSSIYPIVWGFAQLDKLIPMIPGFMRISKFSLKP